MSQDLKALQNQLSGGNPKQRADAVKLLVQTRSKSAGKILVQALKSEEHPKVRERIQKGIQFLKNALSKAGKESSAADEAPEKREATEEMIATAREWIDSEEEESLKKAMQFIVKYDCTQVVPHLIETAVALNDEQTSIRTLKVMERLGRREFSDDLIDFLKSENPRIVLCTYEALKAMSCLEDAFIFFKDYLNHENEQLAKASLENLEKLEADGNRDAEEFLTQYRLEEEEKAKKAAFVPYVPDGYEELLPQQRGQQIEKKKKEDKEKKKKAAQAYKFRSMVGSEDPQERIEGMRKLAADKDPEGVELIVQRISEETNMQVLSEAMIALGELGSESSVPAMQNMLNHEDDDVRAGAVEGLTRILGRERPKPVMEKCLKDPYYKVRAQAILALFETLPNPCFLTLSTLANSKDVQHRKAALDVIAELQQDTHLGMIHKFFRSGEEVLVKASHTVLKNWTGDVEIARFILSGGDDYHSFYTSHMENKKIEENRKRESGELEPEVDAASEESNEQEETNPLLKGLKGLFKK